MKTCKIVRLADIIPQFVLGNYFRKRNSRISDEVSIYSRSFLAHKKIIFSGILLAPLVLITFSGCSTKSAPAISLPSEISTSSGSETGSEESVNPEGKAGAISYPMEGSPTFTLAIGDESQVTTFNETLGDTPFGQAWQEETGVNLKVIHPAGSEGFSMLFASGDLPDIIYYNFGSYPGNAPKAIKDQIIYPIQDIMEEHAPDLKRVLDGNEIYLKSSSTPTGQIIGFPFIRGHEELLTSAGIIVRKDWLDDLSMEPPTTKEMLYDTLVAFRDEKGATVPLSDGMFWFKNHMFGVGMATSPFGLVRGNFYQVDGVVDYGYAQPEYKDALEFFHQLYEEKLLDPNFATLDDNTKLANLMNGESGVCAGPLNGVMGNCLQTMKDKDPNFDLIGVPSLSKSNGERAFGGQYENPVIGNFAVITPACDNKELAAKFLNYAYTEEGHMLFNFGVEGESYTIENGSPLYTEYINNNSDGMTKQQAMAQYTRSWMNGPMVQDVEYIRQYANLPQQQAALKTWIDNDSKDYAIPPIMIAEEDAAEFARISNDVYTYVDEMFIKFITGVESLDNFDTYLDTLNSMGIGRMIEIQQNAYNEFNSR